MYLAEHAAEKLSPPFFLMVYNASLSSLEQNSSNPKPMVVMKSFIPLLKAGSLCFNCYFTKDLQFGLV